MTAEHPNYMPAVQNLQRYLRQLAFFESDIPQPAVDGVFGSVTQDALRAFQRSRALPVTGNADADTWELLYRDYRASLAQNSPPRYIAVFPISPIGYAIPLGSRGNAVTILQLMLRDLQYRYAFLADVEATGQYDEQTENAIRRFQAQNQIAQTGKTDQITWNAIADQFNTLALDTKDE